MTRNHKRIVRRICTAAAALGIALSLLALGYAYWMRTGDTGNILTMASYQNKIVEKYQAPAHVEPSQSVDKIVNIKNTGTVDTLIRVSVRKVFGEQKADGSFAEDKALDPEMIQIKYNTTWWTQEKDGYFYYKKILPAGKETEEPLMESFTLSEKAGNEYAGKEAGIIISMESVQAQGDAVSVWGVTCEELNIRRPSEKKGEETCVNYMGKSQGFDVTEDSTDLFASFKNLLPGCGRVQKIRIGNQSVESVELFLRAEAANQTFVSKREKELIRQLLETYAVIEIKEGNTQIYKGPVSGNLKGNGNSMKKNISLGRFEAHENKELTVTLSLDSEMDNEFCELTGRVKWVFTALGEDKEETESLVTSPPVTGDNVRVGMWIALLVTSALGLAAAYAVDRKIREKEME